MSHDTCSQHLKAREHASSKGLTHAQLNQGFGLGEFHNDKRHIT